MARTRSRVTIFDASISELFDRYGDAGKYGQLLLDDILDLAIVLTPKRSGELVGGYRKGGVLKAGPYRARGSVNNVSDHALFVMLGTTGPIVPLDAEAMPVPVFRGSWGLTPRFPVGPNFKLKFVNGQRGQNFFQDAADEVLSGQGLSVSKLDLGEDL